MRNIIVAFIIFPFLTLSAQVREIKERTYFKQNNLEFNFSTHVGIGFSTTTQSGTYQNYYDSSFTNYTETTSERPFNLLFSASVSYFILDGFSVEPEFDINIIADAEMSVSLLANLSYTFNIPGKNVYPFIKLGYGVSNYNPRHHFFDGTNDNSLDTRIFNAGAGFKFVYTAGMSMNIGITYKNYSTSSKASFGYQYYTEDSKEETVTNAIVFSIGLSILL